MNRTVAQLLAAVGGLLLLAALILGLSPVKASGFDCGNAFYTKDEADLGDLTNAFLGVKTYVAWSCDDNLSSRRTLTWTLGGVGLAALLVGAVTMQPKHPRPDGKTWVDRVAPPE
jgi:hypothetical protein